MGLTIYYSLRTPRSLAPDFRDAIALLGQLRAWCLEQNFQGVGPVLIYGGERDPLAPHAYDEADAGERLLFGLSAQQLLWTDPNAEQAPEVPEGVPSSILPSEAACFPVHPAEGSETAFMGLASYPAKLGRKTTCAGGGWYWRSFCKTQ